MGVGRILLVIAVLLTAIVGGHGYLWWRLVKGPFRSRRARWAGVGVLFVVVVCAMLGLRGSESLPGPIRPVLAWAGSLWVAVFFYLLLALLVLEPVRLVVRLALRGQPTTLVPVGTDGQAPDVEQDALNNDAHGDVEPAGTADQADTADQHGAVDRRMFLARAAALTAGVAALTTVGYGVAAARNVRVKRVPITLPRLDPRLDGFRIAVLTDIHISGTLKRGFVEHTVRTVNGLQVDAVAIVGDLVDGSVDDLKNDAEPLADLRSAHGTFFVTGNHEYFSGAADWVAFLPSLGVRVLRNEHVELGGSGFGFDLAGIDDYTAADSGVPGHGANLGRALAGHDPDRPVVLMAHQPKQWPDAVRHQVDLQLSGHTHGGQLWPFTLAVPLDQPIVAGLAHDGASQIYVSRGVGTWGPPVRVGAPPEISLVELRSPR